MPEAQSRQRTTSTSTPGHAGSSRAATSSPAGADHDDDPVAAAVEQDLDGPRATQGAPEPSRRSPFGPPARRPAPAASRTPSTRGCYVAVLSSSAVGPQLGEDRLVQQPVGRVRAGAERTRACRRGR